jgi:NitT/TauT family transport system substrate-binding protein
VNAMSWIRWSYSRARSAPLAGFAALTLLGGACATPAATPAPAAASKPAAAAPAGGASTPAAAAPAPPSAATNAPASAAAPAGAASVPPAGPPLKVRMGLTTPSGSYMPVWVAQEAGYFTQEGVDLDTSVTATNPAAMAAFLANEIDLFVGASEAAVAVGVDGGDVTTVGTVLGKIVQALYTQPTITEPALLRGKALGITRFGALSESSLRYLLKQSNLNPDQDVSLRQLGGYPEIAAALSTGGIDGGILAPPFNLAVKDLGMIELASAWSAPLEYPAITVNVHKQRTPEQDEAIRRVMRALVEGTHRVKTDKAYSVKVLADKLKSDDPRANEDAHDLYAPLFERELRVSRAQFQTALEELGRTRPEASSIDPTTMYDNHFVDELAQSGFVDRLYGR